MITSLKRVAHYSALLATFYAKTKQYEKALAEFDSACDQMEYLYTFEHSVCVACFYIALMRACMHAVCVCELSCLVFVCV